MAKHIAALGVVFALTIAAACGGSPGDDSDPVCQELEAVADRSRLLSRSEAVELVTGRLAFSAPEVTGVKIEGVMASCLTTLLSYDQDLRKWDVWPNPSIRPHETPVWIVEVKGISRPAGIAAANAANPYRYAMSVIDARTGDSIAGSRYSEPRLASAHEE